MVNPEATFENVCKEHVPFYALSPKEREILQYVSEGYEDREIGDALGIARMTVSKHKVNIGRIGLGEKKAGNVTDVSLTTVIVALIQDGIRYQYLKHKVNQLDLGYHLTQKQADVLGCMRGGATSAGDIAKELGISIHTAYSHIDQLRGNLGTRNNYHTIARAEHLEGLGVTLLGPSGMNRKRLRF